MPNLAEKYRPKTFDEFIGQKQVVEGIKEIIKKYKSGAIDKMPDLLFTGPAGTGKTSMAYIIARELYGDKWKIHFIEKNASDERSIEVIRTEIKQSARSKIGKIIFLDEADNLTYDAFACLRRIMELTPKNTFFILSCNYLDQIIEPIQDRCCVFIFNPLSESELLDLALNVLEKERVEIDDIDKVQKALQLLVTYADGSARKLLNTLEKMIIVRNGKKYITYDTIVSNLPEDISDKLIECIIQDKLSEAINLLEDTYIKNRFDPNFTIKRLYDSVKRMYKLGKIEKYEYAVAMRELAIIEDKIKAQRNPLLQFSRFISSLWLSRYSRKVSFL